MTDRFNALTTLAAAALLASGCGASPATTQPGPQDRSSLPASGQTSGTETRSGAGAATNGAEPAERLDPRGAELAGRIQATLARRIYFDYDKSDLRADGRQTLDLVVAVLRDAPAVAITVAGHADERGSDEYNLALGNRRANEVRRYLGRYGIDASRIQVVSYGEERPASEGHDEPAWSQNRRAEFTIDRMP